MLVSAFVSLALPISQTALTDIARAEKARLNSCIELADTDPMAAYELEQAQPWIDRLPSFKPA